MFHKYLLFCFKKSLRDLGEGEGDRFSMVSDTILSYCYRLNFHAFWYPSNVYCILPNVRPLLVECSTPIPNVRQWLKMGN
jgi:hypothetical protein